jgi:glycosyltransferase involved in cell wall biosynthesis
MLSIVIITLNEEECLPRLLDSIKAQTLQPNEIIVADSNSTDRTCEIANAYGAKVVEGGLPSAGRNNGARSALSDLILFLDADVELIEKDFLKQSVAEIEARDLDIATCDVWPLSESMIDRFLHSAYNKYVRLCGAYIPHAPGFCIFVKKEMHDRIGGFDEEVLFAEDHDYARRSVKAKGVFGIVKSRVPVSVRRLERDGRINIFLKYLLGELHLIFLGPVKDNKFNYSFGHKKNS